MTLCTHRSDADVNADVTYLWPPSHSWTSAGRQRACCPESCRSEWCGLPPGRASSGRRSLASPAHLKVGTGDHSDGTNLHTAARHYATIILLCLIGNSPPARAPAGRLESRLQSSIPEQRPARETHRGGFRLTQRWTVCFTAGPSSSLRVASPKLQRNVFSHIPLVVASHADSSVSASTQIQ